MSEEIIIDEVVDKEKVKNQIYDIRGLRVMLDKDIAVYFGVTTGNLNKAMKRNIKRFPDAFCFQLTSDECSRFQIGILNGNRGSNLKYLPFAYTEQGVAMLTSTLHTERAIEASIQIMDAFVEMSHYIRQNQRLLPHDELKTLEIKHFQLADKVQHIEDNMVTKSTLSEIMRLFDTGVESREILIFDGEPFKADMAYQKIYKAAKKSIILIDDYLGVKTLHHLSHARTIVDITVISDNKGYNPLRRTEYNDYLTEYPARKITFIKSENRVHDRYIILDYGSINTRVFHCGASSKDAGKKITTITEIKDVNVYRGEIKGLLTNPTLTLK